MREGEELFRGKRGDEEKEGLELRSHSFNALYGDNPLGRRGEKSNLKKTEGERYKRTSLSPFAP